MSAHAILSASGAHRWLHCPPSALLERGFTDNTSEAAAEGSAAHALAEYKLRRALKMRSKKPVSQYDCEEMDENTDAYVQYVMELIGQAKDPKVMIEQRLDFSRFVPDGYGTGDCLIIDVNTLQIVDLKYGSGVLVEAENNPQLMLYALGALEIFDGIYDINTVSMTIFQPRRENICTFVMTKDALYQWANDVLKPIAQLAYKGKGEYHPGEHCQFCRAAIRCRARAEEKLRLAALEFALPPLLSDDEISEILSQLDDLTTWANTIKEYALHAALSGKRWDGYKLVEGRSNRRYINEEAVAQAAKEAGYTDVYRQSLLTITEMEKYLSKPKFNEILGDLVVKPPGKPTLVPVTDKRPEINTAKNDFMEEI